MNKVLTIDMIGNSDIRPAVEPANRVVPSVEPIVQEMTIQRDVNVSPVNNVQNLASPTKKKGVNWLFIGGVALGAIIIYKMIKK